jgi:hypothetical protein
MSIKLKGKLEWDLRRIGLMPGMIIEADPDTASTSGVVHFEIHFKGTTYNCSVWPENYDSRFCRVCGCTDDDCHQCIKKTGQPCHWVEFDLCSACSNPKFQKSKLSKLLT